MEDAEASHRLIVMGSAQQVGLGFEQHPGRTEEGSFQAPWMDLGVNHTPIAPRPCCSAPGVPLLAMLLIILRV